MSDSEVPESDSDSGPTAPVPLASSNSVRKRGRPKVLGGVRNSKGKLQYKRKKKNAPTAAVGVVSEGTARIFEEEEMGVDEDMLGNTPIDLSGVKRGDPLNIPPASIDSNIREAVSGMHQELTSSQSAGLGGGNILTQVSPVNRLALTRMIKAYQERFSGYFGEELKKELKSLDKKSDAKLADILAELKFSVFAKTQPAILRDTYFSVVELNESLIGADGLGVKLRGDQHVNDLLDEVNIKYQHHMYVEPEYRLLYCTVAAAAMVRKMNSSNSAPGNGRNVRRNGRVAANMSARVPAGMGEKYNDL